MNFCTQYAEIRDTHTVCKLLQTLIHTQKHIYMPVYQTTYRNKNISNTIHTNKILIINIYKNKNDETKSYFISDSSCMRICKRN